MRSRKNSSGLDERAMSLRNRKLFIAALANYVVSADLYKHFSVYGEIEEATVIYDRLTTRSRGYGFVTFVNEEDAKKAIANREPVIEGKKADCRMAIEGAAKTLDDPPYREKISFLPYPERHARSDSISADFEFNLVSLM